MVQVFTKVTFLNFLEQVFIGCGNQEYFRNARLVFTQSHEYPCVEKA